MNDKHIHLLISSRRVMAVAAASALLLGAAGTVQAQDLLRINGEPITLAEVEAANPSAASNATLRAQVAEQLGQQALLAQTVEDVPADLAQRINAAQQNIKRQSMAQLAANRYLSAHPISMTQIEAEYKKLIAAQGSKQYWVRWLVLKSPQEAQTALETLKSGKQGFAELAITSSIGQNAELGGALGWQTEQSLPAAVLAVVRRLKDEQVAGPIALDNGYAIVQVLATRDAPKPTLAQLKPQIEQQLRNAELQRHITELAKAAKIENLMQATPATTPPEDGSHAQRQ